MAYPARVECWRNLPHASAGSWQRAGRRPVASATRASRSTTTRSSATSVALSSAVATTSARSRARATAVTATLYSLVETAKLHDVEPARCLREAVLAVDRGEVSL